MELKQFNIDDILIKIADIKKNRKKVINNYFGEFNNNKDKIFNGLILKETLIFMYNDHGINRVYFYSCNEEELKKCLNELPLNSIFDYITRNPEEYKELFIDCKYDVFALFQRMVPKKMSFDEKEKFEKRMSSIRKANTYNEEHVCIASLSDAEQIYNKLYEVFDPRTSHFCSVDELCKLIENKWVYIHKENNRINAIYIYKIEGKKKYGYQLYNDGPVEIIYSLCMKADEEIAKQDIKYSYGWVDSKNRRAIRFNEFFGSRLDDLYDVIYEKRG